MGSASRGGALAADTMREPSATSNPPEPGPAPERPPWLTIGVTAATASLWLVVVIGAPWLARPIRDAVNDLDLRFGWWSKARPAPDEAPEAGAPGDGLDAK